MKKVLPLGLVALLGLAACGAPEVNQPPVRYKATKALNEAGTSSFNVATYTRAEGSRKAVSGVPCTFEGDGFSSSFVTPAVVVSPNMQVRTPVASVTCTLNGVKKTQVINPFNETMANINSSVTTGGVTGGFLGLLVGGAIAASQAAARDVAQDVYGYPDVTITFD